MQSRTSANRSASTSGKCKFTRPGKGLPGRSLLVPIDAHVACRPADRHNVDAPIIVEIRGRHIFHRDTTVIDNVPGPLGAIFVGGFINTNPATFARLIAKVVSNTNDNFGTIIIQISPWIMISAES